MPDRPIRMRLAFFEVQAYGQVGQGATLIVVFHQDWSGVGSQAVDEGRRCNGAGEVWHNSYEVRLAYCGNFHHLGNTTDVRQCGPNEINVVTFDQWVEVPPVAPFFTCGQGDIYLAAQDG